MSMYAIFNLSATVRRTRSFARLNTKNQHDTRNNNPANHSREIQFILLRANSENYDPITNSRFRIFSNDVVYSNHI